MVFSGLAEGEEIGTNGTFSVDAAAQLAGKPSMMNPVGGASSTGHDHGTMSETGSVEGNTTESDHDHSTTATTGDNLSASTGHTEFRVEGNCEMCKERIETTAKKVHGVETANWIIDTKQLHLTFDKSHTDLDEVKKAIADAGHDNDKYRAPDTIYNSLPECCLYRK